MALATMQQIGQAFVATRPELRVNVLPSLGTAGGLAAVSEGAIDLSLSARTLNAAEDARGLRSLAYARTPVAFVTHLALGVTASPCPRSRGFLPAASPRGPMARSSASCGGSHPMPTGPCCVASPPTCRPR